MILSAIFSMLNRRLTVVGTAVFISLLTSCASIVAPQGGPKDETPPALDSAASMLSGQTNFTQNQIDLTFNEWIKLDNASQQILISPPLNKKPTYKLKGKTVTVKWDEKLRENTTYTVNFGTAVKDLTEGNVPPNFQFVFSTGAYLDSLTLSGSVVNAETGAPEKDIWVILHENLADSAFQKQLPYYFSKTDEAGKFSMKNLKKGTFKAYALKDENFNYKFDLMNEKVGFLLENIVLTDSVPAFATLRLFENEQPQKFLRAVPKLYGRSEFIFSEPPAAVSLQLIGNTSPLQQYTHGDTLTVLHPNQSGNLIFLLKNADNTLDSIKIKTLTKEEWLATKPKLGWQTASNPKSRLGISKQPLTLSLLPTDTISLSVNMPLTNYKNAQIMLTDSSQTSIDKKVIFNPNKPTELRIVAAWNKAMNYQLKILPTALEAMENMMNTDTLKATINLLSEKELGTITIKENNLLPENQYLIQLLNANKKPIYTEIVANKTSFEIVYKRMRPAAYSLRIIEDRNKNGKWDTGNFLKKQLPEFIRASVEQPLKPNWDLELSTQLKSKKGK